MKKIAEIEALVATMKADAEKFFNGNKSAGTRVRKGCQEIKKACQELRGIVQDEKNKDK